MPSSGSPRLPMNASQLKAHAALLIVALLYGANYLIAKRVMNDEFISPLGFVLLRILMATALFWLVSLFSIREKIERGDWLLFAVCGLTGVAANQTLFFSGLELTTPIHASLIMTTNPVLVLVFSHFILHEMITSRKIAGIIAGCTGAVVLMLTGHSSASGQASLAGDAMVFANAASYALYLVLVKRLTSKYHPLTVVKIVFTIGLVYVIPIGYNQLSQVEWSSFTPAAWWAVVYVVLGVTFLAYLLNLVALRRVNPSTVSIYIYLQPLFASILSVMVGFETLDAVKIGCGLLIFLGVFLVSDIARKRPLTAGK